METASLIVFACSENDSAWFPQLLGNGDTDGDKYNITKKFADEFLPLHTPPVVHGVPAPSTNSLSRCDSTTVAIVMEKYPDLADPCAELMWFEAVIYRWFVGSKNKSS